MKRVLVIATGGTIASAEEGSGLAPALTGEQLVAFVPEVAQVCHVEVSQVMNVDSTNMRPEGWLTIAGEVRRSYDDFDGFVVLHGTDTPVSYTHLEQPEIPAYETFEDLSRAIKAAL